MDTKIVLVALNGLENILKIGQKEVKDSGAPNPYAVQIEECFGKNLFFLYHLASIIYPSIGISRCYIWERDMGNEKSRKEQIEAFNFWVCMGITFKYI